MKNLELIGNLVKYIDDNFQHQKENMLALDQGFLDNCRGILESAYFTDENESEQAIKLAKIETDIDTLFTNFKAKSNPVKEIYGNETEESQLRKFDRSKAIENSIVLRALNGLSQQHEADNAALAHDSSSDILPQNYYKEKLNWLTNIEMYMHPNASSRLEASAATVSDEASAPPLEEDFLHYRLNVSENTPTMPIVPPLPGDQKNDHTYAQLIVPKGTLPDTPALEQRIEYLNSIIENLEQNTEGLSDTQNPAPPIEQILHSDTTHSLFLTYQDKHGTNYKTELEDKISLSETELAQCTEQYEEHNSKLTHFFARKSTCMDSKSGTYSFDLSDAPVIVSLLGTEEYKDALSQGLDGAHNAIDALFEAEYGNLANWNEGKVQTTKMIHQDMEEVTHREILCKVKKPSKGTSIFERLKPYTSSSLKHRLNFSETLESHDSGILDEQQLLKAAIESELNLSTRKGHRDYNWRDMSAAINSSNDALMESLMREESSSDSSVPETRESKSSNASNPYLQIQKAQFKALNELKKLALAIGQNPNINEEHRKALLSHVSTVERALDDSLKSHADRVAQAKTRLSYYQMKVEQLDNLEVLCAQTGPWVQKAEIASDTESYSSDQGEAKPELVDRTTGTSNLAAAQILLNTGLSMEPGQGQNLVAAAVVSAYSASPAPSAPPADLATWTPSQSVLANAVLRTNRITAQVIGPIVLATEVTTTSSSTSRESNEDLSTSTTFKTGPSSSQ